jgi:hypothetical protein
MAGSVALSFQELAAAVAASHQFAFSAAMQPYLAGSSVGSIYLAYS